MRYEQLTPQEAMIEYCEWLISQQVETSVGKFFRIIEEGNEKHEWYMAFYPLRTLMLAGKLLNRPEYFDVALPYFDTYVDEQLPNGAFTSNFRNQKGSEISHEDFVYQMLHGRLNLADNGSNSQALIQAAMLCGDEDRRVRYLAAVKKWFDNWTLIFALPNGAYGNGFWSGQKPCSPYSMAANVCSAFSAYTLATGDEEYINYAEKFIMFLCDHWLEDGRPIRFNSYPVESNGVVDDFARMFYLLEAMCWTHLVSKKPEVRARIEERLRQWLLTETGIFRQWHPQHSFFNCRHGENRYSHVPEGMYSTKLEVRVMWELAKANGILHCFSYIRENMFDDPEISTRYERGIKFLSHPLKARSTGICCEPEEAYGAFAVQATGFAGLSLAEAIKPGSAFSLAM